jgi:hypothetical protein
VTPPTTTTEEKKSTLQRPPLLIPAKAAKQTSEGGLSCDVAKIPVYQQIMWYAHQYHAICDVSVRTRKLVLDEYVDFILAADRGTTTDENKDDVVMKLYIVFFHTVLLQVNRERVTHFSDCQTARQSSDTLTTWPSHQARGFKGERQLPLR